MNNFENQNYGSPHQPPPPYSAIDVDGNNPVITTVRSDLPQYLQPGSEPGNTKSGIFVPSALPGTMSPTLDSLNSILQQTTSFVFVQNSTIGNYLK